MGRLQMVSIALASTSGQSKNGMLQFGMMFRASLVLHSTHRKGASIRCIHTHILYIYVSSHIGIHIYISDIHANVAYIYMICAYHAMPCLTKLPSSVAIQQSLTWQPGSRQLAQELSASRTTVTWVLFSCFPTSLGRWQPELLSPFGWDGPKNIGKSMGDFNYLSLPPSLPPTGELGFLVTSGRMQLQIYTCVLIVWEASSHGVCVLERKRRPLGRTLNQNYPWEKRTNNMMNCIFMILSHMIYIYMYIQNLHIWHNHMHIDGRGSKHNSKNQWLEFTKGDISRSEWWLSRDPIDELPSGFDGTLGVKTSSANKQAVKSVDRSHGRFQ